MNNRLSAGCVLKAYLHADMVYHSATCLSCLTLRSQDGSLLVFISGSFLLSAGKYFILGLCRGLFICPAARGYLVVPGFSVFQEHRHPRLRVCLLHRHVPTQLSGLPATFS